MKQVLINKGNVITKDVPAPVLKDGEVLVRVINSCISIGTELAGIKISEKPLWMRALQQPNKVVKTLKMTTSEGVSRTKNIIQAQLDPIIPIGYSNAGEIIQISDGVSDLDVGDRVACAGSQCAYHAEIVAVPRNLVVPIPTQVDYSSACTITMGAIALQGIRRAEPSLGETFVIIGLGALGQLTSQLLKANGCKAIGIDIDPRRIEVAKNLGLDIGITNEGQIETVAKLTHGYGADGVIITATSDSDEIISSAFQMCRKKGRVVLVGDIGLNINRSDIYEKELDFFISTSYGPGRYDRKYEEEGLDYPISYARWTENRNMQEFAHLLATGDVNVSPLIEATYDIGDAPNAYQDLLTKKSSPLFVLLEFSSQLKFDTNRHVIEHKFKPLKSSNDAINIAVIGVGNYSKSTHLPILKSLSESFNITAIAARNGHNAVAMAEKYRARFSTTDVNEIFTNPEIDAVLIATRHDLHEDLTISALNYGKHVLVEKPPVITRDGLEKIAAKLENNSTPVLLTGFNRNFSPYIQKLKTLIPKSREALILNYRMNAGYIPADSWVHSNEGGGRNIGEACHIYALFTLLTDSIVKKVQAQSISPTGKYYKKGDNFAATITFENGSLATLTFTALGSNKLPKEYLEVYVDGKAYILDNYRKLTVYDSSSSSMSTKAPNKGQKELLQVFADAIYGKCDLPIPIWQQLQAMKIAFDVEDAIYNKTT